MIVTVCRSISSGGGFTICESASASLGDELILDVTDRAQRVLDVERIAKSLFLALPQIHTP